MTVFQAAFLLLFCLLPFMPRAGNAVSDSTQAPQGFGSGQAFLFLENKGQVLDQHGNPRTDILFLGRSQGVKVAISATGISYQFERSLGATAPLDPIDQLEAAKHPGSGIPEPSEMATYRLDMHLLGANPDARVLLDHPHPYYENYYNIPSAPDGILMVRAYEKITLQDVYPGIDWVIYAKGETMKYDFVVHPGADPMLIKMEYDGAVEMAIEGKVLKVKTPLGEVVEEAPITYSGAAEIPSWFELEDGVLSFGVAEYDPTKDLVIDPALIWSTYYGGTGDDQGYATCVDPSGNVYLAGNTVSSSNIASGGHDNSASTGWETFLVKFNASGTRLWATYYGGTGNDYCYLSATDGTGNVFLGGFTNSTSSIAASGHQSTLSGPTDAFLVKFNAAGVRQWGTYYGGTLDEDARGVSTDAAGNVYLAGYTYSNNAIASAGHQNTFGGGTDAFLVKFNFAGVRQWGTYYGGTGADYGYGTSTDGSGNVYLSGETRSTTNIEAGGHQSAQGGNFLVQFNTTTGVRNWGTYYGTLSGYGGFTTTDNQGNVYLGGATSGISNIASGGHQNINAGGTDAFLAKFNSAGVRLWGTYYGGPSGDYGLGAATDGSGNVFLTGYTGSLANIASNGHQNSMGGGSTDGFLVKFSPTGTRQWGTYFGGTDDDYGFATATDGLGNVYLAGETESLTNIASGGHQNTFGGGFRDAFLAKFVGTAPNLAPTAICQNLTVTANSSCQGTATASQFNNGSSDPESDPLSFSVSPAGPYALGLTNVVLSVSDGQGHTSTCSATITVTDNQPPAITCPANITTNTDIGICQAYITFVEPVGTDNCQALTTLVAGHGTNSSYTVGTTTNIYRATDLSGNSTTCSFTVTVIDWEYPSWILCPPFMTANAGTNSCGLDVNMLGLPAHDNCQMSLTITSNYPGTTFPVGSTPVTYVATDGAGNSATCSLTVNVIDNQIPAIACPPNASLTASVGACSATATYTTPIGTDNCASATTTQTTGLPSNSAFPVGVTTNTFRVTDASSNSATCAFTVTVTDTQAPTAICQPVTLQLDPNGNGSTTANAIDNGSSDNCTISSTTLSQTAFACANLGANTVMLTVTDVSGNTSTCNATVTVVAQPITLSATPATAHCGYNITCAGATDGSATATGTGGCPPYTYSWSNSATTSTVTGLGAGTYTVTVTDASGGTAVQSVTLTAPVALQATAISSATCTGETDGSIDLTVTGGNDCQGYSFAWSNGAISEDISGLAAGTYTVTITDIAGCTQTLTQTVNALPLPQPTFTQSGNLLTATQTWSSYQWLFNGSNIPGATLSSYTLTQTGSYALQVTDTNGCVGISNASTIVGITPGTGEWAISLHPNPARGEFKLRTSQPITEVVTVRIHDMFGRQVFARELPGMEAELTFDITQLAAGTYRVEVVAHELQMRKRMRLVVQ